MRDNGNIKIGMLTCSNTTRVLDCPAGACLKDMYDKKGTFEKYINEDIELVGISSCNGCPTIGGAATILPKIETLISYGTNDIHLSYCMVTLCPFVKKYIKVIKEKFPKLNLIEGTHEPHQTDEKFRCDIGEMLQERRKTIMP